MATSLRTKKVCTMNERFRDWMRENEMFSLYHTDEEMCKMQSVWEKLNETTGEYVFQTETNELMLFGKPASLTIQYELRAIITEVSDNGVELPSGFMCEMILPAFREIAIKNLHKKGESHAT